MPKGRKEDFTTHTASTGMKTVIKRGSQYDKERIKAKQDTYKRLSKGDTKDDVSAQKATKSVSAFSGANSAGAKAYAKGVMSKAKAGASVGPDSKRKFD